MTDQNIHLPEGQSPPQKSCGPKCACTGEKVQQPSTMQQAVQEMLAENLLNFRGADVSKTANLESQSGLMDVLLWQHFNDTPRPANLSESQPESVAPMMLDQELDRHVDRRTAVKSIATGLLTGLGLLNTACNPLADGASGEKARLNWKEYFKGNFRLMDDSEKEATVSRLERLYEMNTGKSIQVSTQGPQQDVLYGYAFNISKCRGYMDCVRGCIKENNQDRRSGMQYIRIHEHKKGQINFEHARDDFFHEVPAEGHFYIGTQCFHCENPPCVDVCPVQATWKEVDGIVVVDYDWCIGCRYCGAACPYDARRFNWHDPVVPEEEVNRNQHYLGNRLRKKGVMEKCTFCIQRTRQGKNPACVEACPTGARVFGNLLDPNSQIRWILKNKKVFRLKEDLGTEPKFWYFMD